MTQQTINVGTVANDNTGDPIRTAFTKDNANTLELYKAVSPATILTSNTYGLVGDNSTDNSVAIEAWITAARAIITGGGRVTMIFTPGVYRTTGRHSFPGEADIEFKTAILTASGTDETAPLMTHGELGSTTGGVIRGAEFTTTISSNYYDRRFVALRLLNKSHGFHEVKKISFFYIGVQFQADTQFCAYNTLIAGAFFSCKEYVNFNCASPDSAFPSENNIFNGDCQNTGTFGNFGNSHAMTFTRDWETGGYAAASGNHWWGPSMQVGSINNTLPSAGALTAGRRYYTAKMGGEWLCKTAGTSAASEPTGLPSFVRVQNITLTASSAIATMADTTGLVAGMHVRGSNPKYAFPINTYIQSVDSGVQITLTQVSTSSSTNYDAHFVAVTTSGSATLVFLGPYRRGAMLFHDAGSQCHMYSARHETGAGEPVVICGHHLWPMTTAGASFGGMVTATFQSNSVQNVNKCLYPTRANTTAYVIGDMVIPVALLGEYWECVTAGTSTGSEPTPSPTTDGTTFTDGTVTWRIRTLPTTAGMGWGEYHALAGGTSNTWNVQVRRISDHVTNSATLDNLNLRAIGSATGWLVKGACKNTTSGVLSQSFAAGDLTLSSEGLILNSTSSQLGFLLRTTSLKHFMYHKQYGSYTSSRFHLMPFGEDYKKMVALGAAQAYHKRIQSALGVTGANEYAEPSDNFTGAGPFLVSDEVPYVFCGIVKGSTGTPVACSISGISITEQPHSLNSTTRSEPVQIFTLAGNDHGLRQSLGTPTSGYFLALGEYIRNATVENTRGWQVTTAGILAPAWVTSTIYVRGQLVSAGGNVYSANGSFTSGTTPSGTASYFLDSTATSIVSGDSATWNYVAPLAVLAVDGFETIAPTDSTTQNDWNPTGLSGAQTIAWVGTATTILNGLTAQGTGRRRTIKNNTSTSTGHLLLLTHANTGSAAANRFNLQHAFPLPLMPGDSVVLEDNGSTGWDVISYSAGGQPMGMSEFSDFIASTLGPFQNVNSGTGATVASNSSGADTTEKAVGVMILTLGTTTTGRAGLGASSNGIAAPTTFSGLVVFRGNRSSIAADGTETYSFIIGFQDASGGTWTDGAAWEYRWNGSAEEWSQTTMVGAVATRTVTGSPTPDGTQVWLMVYVNKAWTKAAFLWSQDSMAFNVHEVTAGLPASTDLVHIGATAIKSAGTTSRSMAIDLLGYRVDGLRG